MEHNSFFSWLSEKDPVLFSILIGLIVTGAIMITLLMLFSQPILVLSLAFVATVSWTLARWSEYKKRKTILEEGTDG